MLGSYKGTVSPVHNSLGGVALKALNLSFVVWISLVAKNKYLKIGCRNSII